MIFNESREMVRALFEYRDGDLYWRECSNGRAPKGSLAGTTLPTGYVSIRINGVSYSKHRLVFLYFSGEWPPLIDHTDRDPANCRIENLRSANRSENAINSKKITSQNTSGFRGVSWCKRDKIWRASIKVKGAYMSLGRYQAAADAARAYDLAAREYHKEFANLNFKVSV